MTKEWTEDAKGSSLIKTACDISSIYYLLRYAFIIILFAFEVLCEGMRCRKGMDKTVLRQEENWLLVTICLLHP